MAGGVAEARDRARSMYDAAEYERSLEAARDGLADEPDDVALLVLAGRAGIELDADDAVEHLRRATELAPSDASAWHYYGEALATEGRTQEADGAFRRAVELDPGDQVALTHLGHTALASGRSEEAVGYLAQAADIAHAATSTAAISLVEMYRSFGQYEQALAQAQRIADAVPDDVLARLDVAELSIAAGRLDEARKAFERVRDLDDLPGHEGYPILGLLQVEIAAENWDRAQDLSREAAAIDPHGLSAEVTAFVREQSGEPAADEAAPPAPTRSQIAEALASSLAEYRGMLVEDRALGAGEPIG